MASCPGCDHSLCPECGAHLDVDLSILSWVCRKCGYTEKTEVIWPGD